MLPSPLPPRVAARALSSNSARTGRATRLGQMLPSPLPPRVAARALSSNSARTGRATRLGQMLPSPLPPRAVARALWSVYRAQTLRDSDGPVSVTLSANRAGLPECVHVGRVCLTGDRGVRCGRQARHCTASAALGIVAGLAGTVTSNFSDRALRSRMIDMDEPPDGPGWPGAKMHQIVEAV